MLKPSVALNHFKFFPAHTLKVILLIFASAFLMSACTSRYFRPVSPPEPLQIKELGDLPYRELWQGYVFNGEKVGFAHLKIESVADKKVFKIYSEADLLIRFLGIGKKITVRSEDIVNPDLSLVSFHYEQNLDEKVLMLDGYVKDGNLSVVQRTSGEVKTSDTKLTSTLYPSSVINIYPVLQGMTVGASYLYPVYDPQTQTIVYVYQSVISFEESRDLNLEPSFKIDTRMAGHNVSSWINPRGETIFELGMGGVLITHKESEKGAKSFLAEASLNKKDLILDFSLIKTNKPITCPRNAAFLEISLEGISGKLPLLQGSGQDVREKQINGRTVAIYQINKAPPAKPEIGGVALNAADRYLLLAPSYHMESDHPEIKKQTEKIVEGAKAPREKVERLVSWVSTEIKDEAVDSFSALEVLHVRKGECQAHTMLYTAMARAAGIPTRLAGGIVYMEGVGFLYHAWAESYLDGWIAVDPTFNQVGVDATHIKLVEGRDWSSLLQLGNVIGHIKAEVINFSCGK